MKKQFDEKSKTSAEEKNESDYAFKSVIKKDMTNRRTISVVSLILAVLSILFFRIPWVGLILAILSVRFRLRQSSLVFSVLYLLFAA